MNDIVVAGGGEIKSLGSRRIGGYAVLFTNSTDLDQQGEFFSEFTDFWLDSEKSRRRLLWDHGRDAQLRTRKLADAELHVAEKGLWCEAELRRMDAVEERVLELTNKGQLGFSSGSASHLVERDRVGNGIFLRNWPISEISVTLTPAEKRCRVQALKSLRVTPFTTTTRNLLSAEQRATIAIAEYEANQRQRDFERSQLGDDAAEMESYYNALAEIEYQRFQKIMKRS